MPFSGALAVQEQVNKVIGALTALAAFIVTILVALRARERTAGTRAAALLFFTGFGALCASLALVCGNAWLGLLFTQVLPPFIAGEWALGKIFETSFGFSKESGGLAAQISSLVLVLILGISARSIHRFVDERLTNTFFRKRMAGLATIERLAHEADSATDVHAYMSLAVKKIEQSLETIGAAFYVRDGDRYARCSCEGAEVFPPEYTFNDEAPLALRRWQKPFECEDGSEHRHHMLFLPMSVRGLTLGESPASL